MTIMKVPLKVPLNLFPSIFISYSDCFRELNLQLYEVYAFGSQRVLEKTKHFHRIESHDVTLFKNRFLK